MIKYQFTIDENYEDYSSGRVIYSATGATNFPVRLSSEVFQRCAHYLKSKGKMSAYTIYDPFCGVAYSLTVIGFLHGNEIELMVASDADGRILEFSKKNLSLLTKVGIEKRIQELKQFIEEYKKASHREALESAYRLQERVQGCNDIKNQILQFNILEDEETSESIPKIDMVITDLPYGKLTGWEGVQSEEDFTQRFLDKLKPKLDAVSVVAIIYDKKKPIFHKGFVVIESFTLGKRQVVFLEPELK